MSCVCLLIRPVTLMVLTDLLSTEGLQVMDATAFILLCNNRHLRALERKNSQNGAAEIQVLLFLNLDTKFTVVNNAQYLSKNNERRGGKASTSKTPFCQIKKKAVLPILPNYHKAGTEGT